MAVQLQMYPRAEIQKAKELVSAEDADPNIAEPREWGENLNLIKNGKVAIVVVESNAERIEREKEEARQQELAKSALKRNVGANYTIIGDSNEECLIYARRVTGKNIHGYAGNVQPTHYDPKVGDVALFQYGHVGAVIAVVGDKVIVRHSNYIKGKIIETTHYISEMRGFV